MTSSVTTYDPLMNFLCGAAGTALLAKGVADMNDPRANAKLALLETVAGTITALYAGNKYLHSPASQGIGIDLGKKMHIIGEDFTADMHFIISTKGLLYLGSALTLAASVLGGSTVLLCGPSLRMFGRVFSHLRPS